MARAGALIGSAIWLVLPAGGVVNGVWHGDPLSVAVALGIGALLCRWPLYNNLFRRCYEIRISETGICEFEAPLATTRLASWEILAIRPSRWEINDQAYVDVLYRGGKLWVMWPVRGFGDFLDRLHELNPGVEIANRAELAPEWVEEPPPTTREVMRAQPLAAAVILVVCCVVAALLLSSQLERPAAVLLAIPTAAAVWLLLMFGVSRGWVSFED